MRLDKFLKISRIFKSRNSAEKSILQGNVLLNNKLTKPSSKIKVGDVLTFSSQYKKIEYQILVLYEKNVSKQEARKMVKTLKEEKIELF